MTYFTFDTAWIVATMQNGKNEIIKDAIKARLDEMRWFPDEEARCNYTSFETTCWAWQNDCLEIPWSNGQVRERPPVNPYPYLDNASLQAWRRQVVRNGCKPCVTARP